MSSPLSHFLLKHQWKPWKTSRNEGLNQNFRLALWTMQSSLLNTHMLKRQKIINNIFKYINFIMESEKDGQLAFLNCFITGHANRSLETRVYLQTDQVMIRHSDHSDNHKQSCIQILLKGAKTHWSTNGPRRQNTTYFLKIFRDIRKINFACEQGNEKKGSVK